MEEELLITRALRRLTNVLRRRGDRSDAEIRDELLSDLERSIQQSSYADRFGQAAADRLLRSYQDSIDEALGRPPSSTLLSGSDRPG
ncbi:hypothetical protein BH23PLA1_BH23PLA1_45180 [soil metagenome]